MPTVAARLVLQAARAAIVGRRPHQPQVHLCQPGSLLPALVVVVVVVGPVVEIPPSMVVRPVRLVETLSHRYGSPF